MIRVLYGDILLLIDFCMNFFVLHTTGIFLRRKVKTVCIIGAAIIGGIYSVAKLFVSGNDFFDCLITFSVGLLMCYICFGGYSFLKTTLIFFSVSALVGGIMFLIYFLLGSYHTDIYGNFNEYAYTHIPLWLFTVLAAISMLISWTFSLVGRESSDRKEEEAFIAYNGRTVSVKLLLDSGNLAREPISGRRVVFLGRVKARNFLGEEIYSAIIEKKTEFLLTKKFRLITASGIDGKKTTYYAFSPDSFYLMRGKNKVDTDAYIAVCDTEVLFGKCDGLAHPSLIL